MQVHHTVLSREPARRAAEVLRDINKWFRTHRVPRAGGGGNPDWPDDRDLHDVTLAELYARHGWPDRFDGDAFEVGLLRRWAVGRVKDDAAMSRMNLKGAQESVNYRRELIEHLEQGTARARTPQGKWAAQWEALQACRVMQSAMAEVNHEREKLVRLEQGLQGDSVPVREYQILRHRLKTLPGPADVERQFPGQAIDLDSAHDNALFDEDNRDRSWGRKLVGILQSDIAGYRAWVARVPEDLTGVRRLVDEAIARAEKDLEGLEKQRLEEQVSHVSSNTRP
ncbi:hypothetical protein PG996_002739 [Apiospora saccharicola]|uniref:Uncharacterized protein n=1 Tax=Apiospora saccharicola TaxID=335842 RepID=A0ABR1WPN7_9PEZI